MYRCNYRIAVDAIGRTSSMHEAIRNTETIKSLWVS